MTTTARFRRAVYDRGQDGDQLFGRRWRSPIRGPWLTSVFASILLIGLPIVAITGLLSFIAYGPQFAGNAFPAHVGYLHLPYFAWPTQPAWLYRFTQGLHVTLGLALIPVVFAKLWSVMPRLFALPPVRSVAKALERLSLFLLVGSILFEIVTGVMNIQYDYSFGFDFYAAHYYGAWVFIAAFVTHVALKLPTMIRALRRRSSGNELRTAGTQTRPEAGAEGPGRHASGGADDQPSWRHRFCGGRRTDRRRVLRRSDGGRPVRGRPHCSLLGDAPAAADRPAFRSTAPREPRGSPPKHGTTLAAAAAGRRARGCSAGPNCSPCRCTRRTCRSPASKDGRRRRRGPESGFADLAGLVGARETVSTRKRPELGSARSVQLGDPHPRPDSSTRQPARTAGERRRSVSGPRLSGPDDRAGPPGSAQHQMGQLDRIPVVVKREPRWRRRIRRHRSGPCPS